MRTCLAALCLLMLFAAPALAQRPVVEGADLLEAGIYDSDIAAFIRDDNVADQNKILSRSFVLKAATTKVRADLGTGFGVKYVLRGSPTGAQVPVEVVVRHPPMYNPRNGVTYTESRTTFDRTIGKAEYSVWSFDMGWTLVPGTFTIQVLYGDRVLVEQRFEVSLTP
ncbi:MAG: DUF3859 domain-containing protein [Desulfovibrionaceae bacterium]